MRFCGGTSLAAHPMCINQHAARARHQLTEKVQHLVARAVVPLARFKRFDSLPKQLVNF